MNYLILAIPTNVAEGVRKTRRSPKYGHPVHSEILADPAPCRHCLRLIQPGEQALLFTYDPFDGMEQPLPGPVYVHALECPRYEEQSVFPSELRASPRTLIGYGDGRRWIREILVPGGGAMEEALGAIMKDEEVRYAHVRSTTAGCFTFRVERER